MEHRTSQLGVEHTSHCINLPHSVRVKWASTVRTPVSGVQTNCYGLKRVKCWTYWSGSCCWWARGSRGSSWTRYSLSAVSLCRIVHIMFTHILDKHTLLNILYWRVYERLLIVSMGQDLPVRNPRAESNWIIYSFSSPFVILYARTSQTLLNRECLWPSSGHASMIAPLTINYTTLQYIFFNVNWRLIWIMNQW